MGLQGPGPAAAATRRQARRQRDRGDGLRGARRGVRAEARAAPFPCEHGPTRAHDLCVTISKDYDGDAEKVWSDATTGDELFKRLRALPGYGDEKSKIFVAILAKRMDVKPDGWEQVAGPFADPTPRSVADIDSPASLAKVREWKKMMKAKGKTKQD